MLFHIPPYFISTPLCFTRDKPLRKRTLWAPPLAEVAESNSGKPTKPNVPHLDTWGFLLLGVFRASVQPFSSDPSSQTLHGLYFLHIVFLLPCMLIFCQTIFSWLQTFVRKEMKSALGKLEGEKQLLSTKWDGRRGSRTAGSWWKSKSLVGRTDYMLRGPRRHQERDLVLNA
jgi:hypothetical protein